MSIVLGELFVIIRKIFDSNCAQFHVKYPVDILTVFFLIISPKHGDNFTRTGLLTGVKDNENSLLRRSEEVNNRGTGFKKREKSVSIYPKGGRMK